MEKKYRTKGFMARSLALYSAARLASRATGDGGDAAIAPIEGITAIRRTEPITPRALDDRDLNSLA